MRHSNDSLDDYCSLSFENHPNKVTVKRVLYGNAKKGEEWYLIYSNYDNEMIGLYSCKEYAYTGKNLNEIIK